MGDSLSLTKKAGAFAVAACVVGYAAYTGFYATVSWSRSNPKWRSTPGQRRSGGRSGTKHEQIWAEMAADSTSEVGFEELGGLESQIKVIQQAVLLPLTRPDLYMGSALARQPTSVLLYGPPGTGKTRLAAAVAKSANAKFISVSCSDILDKFVGASSQKVAALFAYARRNAPAIIFLDECDALLSRRSHSDQDGPRTYNNIVSTFLSCWDGMAAAAAADLPQVIIIGATNRRDVIDPAIARRFSTQVEVPLPNARARESILRVHLTGETTEADLDLPFLASITSGCSGSHLKHIVRIAARESCLRAAAQDESEAGYELIPKPAPITMVDLEKAAREVTGSAEVRTSAAAEAF